MSINLMCNSDVVVVELGETRETKTSSGLFVPESAMENSGFSTGKVVSVGENFSRFADKQITFSTKACLPFSRDGRSLAVLLGKDIYFAEP